LGQLLPIWAALGIEGRLGEPTKKEAQGTISPIPLLDLP